MNDKLMPIAKAVLQTIKRFLWGTYCGLRLCVYLVLFSLILPHRMFPIVIAAMIMFSLLYAVFFHWITAFSKQSSMLKKCVISYVPYMIAVLGLIYFSENAREHNIRQQLLCARFSIYTQILLASFAPVFSIAMTAVELFAKKRLQGWWYRIVKWIYNGIALLPIAAYVAVMVYFFSLDYIRRHRFDDCDAIERITGAPCPDFKVVEYKKGYSSFNGDYNDCLIVEFEQTPAEGFYQALDSLVKADGSSWDCRDGVYYYSRMWGNGLPAPKGEDDDEDMSLSVTINKGEKRAEISYGTW